MDICGLKVPRPLQRHLVVSLLTFAIFLTAFLLFLLVGLSLTITPSIYIMEVSALNSKNPVSNAATTLKFGVWGVCATRRVDPTYPCSHLLGTDPFPQRTRPGRCMLRSSAWLYDSY